MLSEEEIWVHSNNSTPHYGIVNGTVVIGTPNVGPGLMVEDGW
jgi:hypothetical protein